MSIDKSSLFSVTSPKVFLDKNNTVINEDGLYSQRIFGPVKSYKCVCGNYNVRSSYENQRCPKCGVLCASSDLRYSTFGKIELVFPIYKKTYESNKLLNSIIKKEKYILNPSQCDRTLREENYLEYDTKKDKFHFVKKYVIGNSNTTFIIPMKITGIYTFYVSILAIIKIFNSSYAKYVLNTAFSHELLVTPPGTRQAFVQVEEGNINIMQHELNKHYIDILKLSEYDWSNFEGNPSEVIEKYVESIKQNIQTENIVFDASLTVNDQSCCRYQHYSNLIYDNITSSLSGKEGYIRRDFHGRSIDFSSRSHVIPDPTLKAYEIIIPKSNFLRLWFIEYTRFLQYEKKVNLEELLTYIRITESKITYDYPEYIDEFLEYIFRHENWKKRIVLINRQPTLYRYGIPAVIVVGIDEGNCIRVSQGIIDQLNMDFDG